MATNQHQQQQQQQHAALAAPVSSSALAAGATTMPLIMGSNAAIMSSPPIWEMDRAQVDAWLHSLPALFPKEPLPNQSSQEHMQKIATVNKLVQNLLTSVNTILRKEGGDDPPPAKRVKTEEETPTDRLLDDPYSIWDGQSEDPPNTVGAVLVQLTAAGWVNALSGQKGGIVSLKMQSSLTPDTVIPTAAGMTLHQLRTQALTLHRASSTRMEQDFLLTTPIRIHLMLCADVPPHEFKAIRKRVYDTVILGKGMNPNQAADAAEDNNIPVAARTGVHDSEKFKKCKVCGNNDQSLFVLDQRNGDVICTVCGTVAMESVMHEGSQFRKFEGEVDRNHHGDVANPLYSNSHNMSTTLGGMQVTSSAGNGWGTQKMGLETILRNAHAYTEMNISQFGKGERKTREGYKDRQKRDAFIQMTHAGDALNLHEAVVQRAKELFAGFRDDRELVQQFKGVIAACLCEAFEQLSRDGQRILKMREQDKGEELLNSRASKRSDLHHANMAGKGGLQLDLSNNVDTTDTYTPSETSTAAQAATNALEKKPAATWDLDDCRSWLLEASRSIAQQWMEDRKKPDVKNIPEGTQDELEGKLVEHTISLCDQLEAELQSRDKVVMGSGAKKLTTPRVNNMERLSIKWQHAHERGSGGKGGVGNSGRTIQGTKPGEKSGRTPGQILILKTAKKLGAMLKDPISGDAFHRELRALVGRQEARKQKQMRDEAARQRFQQMQRKPWLQARAAQVSS